MSETFWRGRVRSFVVLSWLVVNGAAGEPATEALESGDARGSIRQMQRMGVDDGWVLTDTALLFTRDGGATWSDMAPSQPLDGASHAFFLDSRHAWVAGVVSGSPTRLAVLDTNDGGASWRRQEVPASTLPDGQVYARAQVHFADVAHGWLLGQQATSAAFSLGELLRTTDGGATWERLPRPPAAGRFVFVDAQHGFMTGAPVSERLYRTLDGGRTWGELKLDVRTAPGMALYDLPVFHSAMDGLLALTLRGATPRLLSFVTRDGGRSWRPVDATALPAGDYDEPVPAVLRESGGPAAFAAQGLVMLTADRAPRRLSLVDGSESEGVLPAGRTPSVRALSLVEGGLGWALVAEGGCDAGECRQLTRLLALDGSADAVGAVLELLVRRETLPAAEPDQPLSSGATISFDRGFDKCAAATTTQMQTWKISSPYRDANIYFGGSARACSQPNLSAAWVSTVFGQGWRLIPTWVGPQAPCTSFGTRFGSNPATARSQGLAEAEAAVDGASALGLGGGTPLYYDLELYAENDASCSAAVRAFVDAWTERVQARGYVAGVYGNARNAQADWRTGVIANPPDAVWLTPWVCGSTATTCNWSPTVFGIPGVSDAYWANDQRIRQYWGGHNETYGGVTFNIDSDFANGPVAAGNTPTSCLATVPAGHWKGEYFKNQTLSGAPSLVRDDGTAGLSFNWVGASPSSSCGIGADHFSVRWTRTVSFAAGTYRFQTRTDDGVRLYVDGLLRIDKWIDRGAPPVPDRVDVTLGAGTHTLRMEYYENGGWASAELSWQLISNLCTVSVPGDRWRGEYFNNQTLSGVPALVRDDGAAGLSFDWGTGSPSSSCGIGGDHFSVRWTRTVDFAAGTYRFQTRTDDGVRLYVDGVLKIDKWIDRGAPPAPDSVDVTLGAGNHALRMEYYENGGLASAELSWQPLAGPCSASVSLDRWKGEYWNNREMAGTPSMVRDDGAGSLAFDWGTGTPSASCGIGADSFSARWTRTVSFAAGTYRFTITSDDGFRFYVDGALRLEKWIIQAPTTYTVDVTLGAGSHALRMDYYENGGLAVAKLSWQGLAASDPGFDAASSASAETSDLGWPHTVSGSDRLLLVGASIRGNVPITSVTYGGLPLSKIRHDTFGIDVRSELWYLVGPPVGTQNVTLHLASAQNVIAGATSWTNVDQTSPVGNHEGANHGGTAGTTATVQVASAADQVVVDVVATQAAAATVTAGPPQAVRWNRRGNHGNGAGSSQPGAATTTLSWTLAYPEFWAISAVALRRSAGATALEWPNAASAANSDPWLAEHHAEIRRMRPRVLALNFVNDKSMADMETQLQEVIDAITEGSRYHGYADAQAPAFLQYQLAYSVDLRDAQLPPGWPYRNSALYPREIPVEGEWGFDYERLFTPEFAQHYGISDPDDPGRRLGLCELIDRGLVHEVWIYGDANVPDVNAAEILEMKPLYDENRRRVPGQMNRCTGNGCFDDEDDIPCTRTVRIAWFNNSRGPGCFLESLSHGLESAGGGGSTPSPIPYLGRYFVPFARFDLDARHGLPFRSWYDVCPYDGPFNENCLRYPSETEVVYNNGTIDGTGTVRDYDPVCGNAHFPPNARGQYDLASPAAVRTSCSNYRDGTGKTITFTSGQFAPYANLAPDCTGPWQVWWYQNIPGLGNASRDDAGNAMLNWWPFLFY
jgi:photosystem II stability/assembly factor-like uncharacterized protein